VIKPRFREGELVRVVRQPHRTRTPLDQGVVEDVVGPTEDGTGWAAAVRVGDELWVLAEDDLEAAEPRGAAMQQERFDTLQLRLVTELTDGVEAARVAEEIDATLRELIGPAIVEIEAERHWAEPYNYELDVSVRPLGDAIAALRTLAELGGDGWLSCRDDGWRCDLWWNADDEDEPGFLVHEVRGAEIAFLPWESPARRPEEERPLVRLEGAR
jgi:hypothetical protein